MMKEKSYFYSILNDDHVKGDVRKKGKTGRVAGKFGFMEGEDTKGGTNLEFILTAIKINFIF